MTSDLDVYRSAWLFLLRHGALAIVSQDWHKVAVLAKAFAKRGKPVSEGVERLALLVDASME